MNVLYITYMGLSEPLLYSQGLAYLEGLSRKGHRITILSFEKKEAFQKNGEAILKLRTRLEAKGLEWHVLRYHKQPHLISTFFDLVRGAITAAYLTIKKKVYLIHARGTVPAAIGFLLKRVLKVKLLFDVRGLMAEEYVDGGMWKRGGVIYRVTSSWEQRFLAQADAVNFLSHRILSFFQTTRPELFADHKTIEVIQSCVDLNRFSLPNERDAELQQRFGLEGRFVFIYVGSFGTWYLLNEMLDFFKEAKTLLPNAFFLILTQSGISSSTELLKEKGISQSDVAFTFCPPAEVPRYLSLADAGIFFIRPCFSKLSSSPTKFGEYLASGLPVVINGSVGDTDVLVEKEGIGVVLREFGQKQYQEAVTSLVELMREEGAQLKQKCRQVAERHLSLQSGTDCYNKLYQALFNEDFIRLRRRPRA